MQLAFSKMLPNFKLSAEARPCWPSSKTKNVPAFCCYSNILLSFLNNDSGLWIIRLRDFHGNLAEREKR